MDRRLPITKPRLRSVTSYSKSFHRGISQKEDKYNAAVYLFVGFTFGLIFPTIINSTFLTCDIIDTYSLDKELKIDLPINNFKWKTIEPNKNLVFIGILTAQQFVDTRAKAVFETWANKVPGKISFFTSTNTTTDYSKLIPIVNLPNVDDTHPPQKKSFLMLKYMHDNYLDKFEWFMRVDDDVYLKSDKLELFLRSLNSSKRQFIGQPGQGTFDEQGFLSLNYGENFCMGGPGVIMSRETLQMVVPHFKNCLHNLYTKHEDVEISRCISQYTGISCTWSYEMKHIFYHNSSSINAFTKNLLVPEVLNPITLHPVKQPKYLYRLHNFLNTQKLIELRQKSLYLKRNIFQFNYFIKKIRDLKRILKNQTIQFNQLEFNNIDRLHRHLYALTIKQKYLPKKRSNEHNYKSISFEAKKIYSSETHTPIQSIEKSVTKSFEECLRQLNVKLTHSTSTKEYGNLLEQQRKYAYQRQTPLFGLEYLIIIKKQQRDSLVLNLYLKQTYTDMVFREDMEFNSFYLRQNYADQTQSDIENIDNIDNYDLQTYLLNPALMNRELFKNLKNLTDDIYGNDDQFILMQNSRKIDYDIDITIVNKPINIIIVVHHNYAAFKIFINNFEQICLKNNEKVMLTIVLFWNSRLHYKNNFKIREICKSLRKKYDFKHLYLIETNRLYKHTLGRQIGASLFTKNTLLLFLNIDVLFNREFLLRVRLNTILNRQVYFPIVFNYFQFGGDSYWDIYNYAIMSAYKYDFDKIGGYDLTLVNDDLYVFDKFIQLNSGLFILRTVDTGLIHRIKCANSENNDNSRENLSAEETLICANTKK